MRAYCFILLMFLSGITFAQFRVWKNFGDEALSENDFYGAAKFYEKALKLDSTKTQLYYNLGLAYKGYHNYEKAKNKFLQVDKSPELKVQFPDYLFHLGDIYKGLAQYDSSKYYFELFLKSKPSTRSFEYLKSKAEVKNADLVINLFNDTANVSINNIGDNINSGVAEFYGEYIHDSLLLYSALRASEIDSNGVIKDANYSLKLFTSAYKDSVWGKSQSVKVRSELTDFVDGCLFENDLYFSAKTKSGFYKICKASINFNKKGAFELDTPSIVFHNLADSEFNFRNPFVFKNNGKSYMLFSSDMPLGKGKMDIWYSELRRGEWGRAKNLGSKVNTPGNEVGPIVHPNTGVLYFASDFQYNLGGFDLFKGEGSWNRPIAIKNMGIPFNTSANDLYLNFKDSLSGNLTSGRVGSITDKDAVCCNDIFEFNFPIPEPPKKDTIITSEDIMKRLEKLVEEYHVTLYFHNDRPNPRTWDTITPYNYLTTYKAYIDSIPTYYYRNALGKSGEDSVKAVQKIQDFFDEYVHKGVDDLKMFTKELLKELESGQKIQLTVKGYASPLAKSDYNVNLTLRRINSLENYLAEYENGVFLPYLKDSAENGGLLRIAKVPFGEYRSDSTVSDNYYNTKFSVYSKEASLERKIEVINLTLIEDSVAESKYPVNLDSAQTIINLGVLDTSKFTWRFDLQNLSLDTMKIKNAELSCHCLSANRNQWTLLPGETEPLDLTFDLTGYSGKLGRKVTLNMIDGSKRELIILMELPNED